MLLADKGKIIQILPSAMPHDYKVGSMWLEAIRDCRAAIIARGNSEVEFSRAACLEVNEAAAGIATASGGIRTGAGGGIDNASGGTRTGAALGKAVYWLPEGPKLVS